MKKIITLLLLFAVCTGVASAQIVRSQSRSITVVKEEKPKVVYDHNWFVKAGGGIMIDNRGGDKHGRYSVLAGYQQQFSRAGFYWGAQAGLISITYSDDNYWDSDLHDVPGIFVGPTFGIKRSLGTYITFDPHIGVGYARGFTAEADANKFAWEVGVGIWYKRFLFELEYQGATGDAMVNGALLNIGFKF